jgi:hypothetical protein
VIIYCVHKILFGLLRLYAPFCLQLRSAYSCIYVFMLPNISSAINNAHFLITAEVCKCSVVMTEISYNFTWNLHVSYIWKIHFLIFNQFISLLRLSQPAQLLIYFTISDDIDAESVKYEKHIGDLLVLNLEETELSKRNYANDVPNVECCFTSLLHIRYCNLNAECCYCLFFFFFLPLSFIFILFVFLILSFFSIQLFFASDIFNPVYCTFLRKVN